MALLVTILAFIAIFGLLIFVHEFGHFIVAKRNGIKVEEFAFGLPLAPAIFKRRRGGTTYAIYPVPLGGFVRMLGEDGKSKEPRSFASKSKLIRAKVLVAGVFMNLLLAYLLLVVGFLFKMDPIALCAADYPRTTYSNQVTVAVVTNSGPAHDAGIKPGDVIKSIDGRNVNCHTQVPAWLSERPGQATAMGLERDGRTFAVTVTPRPKTDAAAGKIGIGPEDHYTKLDYPRWEAPYLATIETGAITGQTVVAVGNVFATLLTKATVPQGVSGPVGIAKLTGQVIGLGPIVILRFVAIISLSLAVFNLLPIPALDGGRLLFVGVEAVRRGRPVTPRVENAIHAAGFALLIGFILVITFFDLTR